MTAISGPRRSLLGSVVAAVADRARSRGRSSRLAAAAVKVRENVMTLAALSSADLGGFLVWHRGGWFVLAVSLVLLDFALQEG